MKPLTNAGINLRRVGSNNVVRPFLIKNIDLKNFTQCVEKKRGDISLFDEFLLVCIL